MLCGRCAKAPNARGGAGLPWITPEKADPACYLKLPIAEGDVPYLRDVQAHLNAAVERASEETGATFVDFAEVSDGHDACSPLGTRWIEPLLFGTSLVPVHPNALGERRMAEHDGGSRAELRAVVVPGPRGPGTTSARSVSRRVRRWGRRRSAPVEALLEEFGEVADAVLVDVALGCSSRVTGGPPGR